jgi:hypothetical protein
MYLKLLALSFLLFLSGCQFITNHPLMNSELIKVPHSEASPSSKSAHLELAQPWNDALDEGFQPAGVLVEWNSETIKVIAHLSDTDILTQATEDNQRLWELSDVFEIFLMVEGRSDYVELHVAPNNRRMHVQKPNAAGIRESDGSTIAFEEMLVSPIGFTSETVKTTSGWQVQAHIPAAVLNLDAFTEGTRLRASFCRYDVSSEGTTVLSTTADHPVIAFHRPEEWTRLVLID